MNIAAETIELFLAAEPQRMNELAQAVARDDLATARVVSHRLRGSFHRLSMPTLALVARQLEEAARDGDVDRVRTAFLDLDEAFAAIVAKFEGGSGAAEIAVELLAAAD